jgi:hypothetical protein
MVNDQAQHNLVVFLNPLIKLSQERSFSKFECVFLVEVIKTLSMLVM